MRVLTLRFSPRKHEPPVRGRLTIFTRLRLTYCGTVLVAPGVVVGEVVVPPTVPVEVPVVPGVMPVGVVVVVPIPLTPVPAVVPIPVVVPVVPVGV